jgi:hypothetical protein
MKKDASVLFMERNRRFDDAIALRIPDRVPMEISFGYFPAAYSGLTCEAVYYDYDRWLAACKKVLSEMGEDMSRVQPFFPGQVMELIGPKNMAWPGHGTSALHSHQAIEGEFMAATEYDLLFNDHTDFMLRHYLPRVSEAMQSLAQLPSMNAPSYGYYPVVSLAEALAQPDIALAIERLQQAGRLIKEWQPRMNAFRHELEAMGFPPYTPFRALAPFDAISDHLRGMRGSMLDLYRHPDKILEACDMILKKYLDNVKTAIPGENNRCAIPLHRGAEGFMSIKQFEKFYWPTLKGLIKGLVDKGYIPCVAFEGDYTSRLEYLLELPKGKVLAHMDTTDIFKAKQILKGHLCMSGNVPCSILQTGTPDDVREHCRKLIDYCGKDGGYIMSTRSPVDDARPDTLKALIDFTREYGVYR